MKIEFTPIGYVQNEFEDRTAPEILMASISQIVLEPGLVKGLTGLKADVQIMVVFYFHRSRDCELIQYKHGNTSNPERGVFSLCSPDRPNPIGVTVVDLVAMDGNVLTVRGLDALNNTPVLDIKPAKYQIIQT